ncbi:deoxycytidylate deaminase [Fagus crenata]
MNSRELALVSTATVFGALASAFAFRIFSNPKKKQFPQTHNGVVSTKTSPNPFDPSKRKEYLSWDDYFMAIAFLSAERSKDPNRQVGACLVSHNGIILGIGYNGFPRGCSDDKLPWAKKSKTGDPLETKYPYVCHAEVNAILNTNHASAAGQRLYVTMFPCNECAKIIIQSGVSEVIYFVEKSLSDSDITYIASHKLLSMAGVKARRHQPDMNQILIKFEEPKVSYSI